MITTIAIRTALVPKAVITVGSTKVPNAEAIRLIAEQKPVPEARSSVGKSSAGYTNCSVAPIVKKKINAQKHITKMMLGACDQTPKINSGTAEIPYVHTRSPFLETLSIMKKPAIAPSKLKRFKKRVTSNSFSMCRVAKICGAKVKIGKNAITDADQKMQQNRVLFHKSLLNR